MGQPQNLKKTIVSSLEYFPPLNSFRNTSSKKEYFPRKLFAEIRYSDDLGKKSPTCKMALVAHKIVQRSSKRIEQILLRRTSLFVALLSIAFYQEENTKLRAIKDSSNTQYFACCSITTLLMITDKSFVLFFYLHLHINCLATSCFSASHC